MTSKPAKRCPSVLTGLAIQNILVALAQKVLLVTHGFYGAPIFLTIFLWVFIFKGKRWAKILFVVLSASFAIYGVIAFVLYFQFIQQGFDPLFCVTSVLLGMSYAIATGPVVKELVKPKSKE